MEIIITAILFLWLVSVLAKSDEAGDVPYDFVGKTIDRIEIRVSDFKGKLVLQLRSSLLAYTGKL